MIIFVKDEDEILVIPVGLGPNVGEQKCPEPVFEDITLDSSTMEQTVTPEIGVDGFSSVTVNPVTSSIDPNIQAENIRSGVSILGVTGTYENPNWIIQARKGDITDIRGYSYDGLLNVSNGANRLFYGNPYITAMDVDSSTIAEYGMSNMFYNSSGLNTADLSHIETVGPYGLYYAFYNCNNLANIDISNIKTVSEYGFSNAFRNCTGLANSTLDLRNITSAGAYAFDYAFGSADPKIVYLPKLKDIPVACYRNMLSNDSLLEHIYVDFSETETIGNQAFANIGGLISLGNDNIPDFGNLISVGGGSSNIALDFSNSTIITSVSFPKLTSMEGNIQFTNCANLTSVSYPELNYTGTANYMFSRSFEGTGITSLSFPKLTGYVRGNYFGNQMCKDCSSLVSVSFLMTSLDMYCFENAFRNCTSLTTFSMPNINYVSISTFRGQYTFDNCPNLVNLEIGPTALRHWSTNVIQYSMNNIRNLTLTYDIKSDIRLDNMQYLTADSVLNVLQHCNPDNPGTFVNANIYFYTGGLTVTDYPDGRIQAAYDAATVSGHANTFTIHNLTILPYS